MLGFFFLKTPFVNFCKSGFYIDFFLKKCTEVFVRNMFIYTAQFFGEKYIIEVFTKKIFVHVIFFFNTIFGFTNLSIFVFFNQFLIFLFYLLTVINCILLFL